MRGGELGWETPALNATNPHWRRDDVRSHEQLKTKHLLFCKFYGHETWQGNFLWLWQLTHYLTWPPNTWSHGVIWQIERLIFLLPKGLWAPNFSWLSHHAVTWQTKSKISSLAQRLRSPDLVGWWLIMRRTRP